MTGNIFLISLILWPFLAAFICYIVGWRINVRALKKGVEKSVTARDNLVVISMIVEFGLFMLCLFTTREYGNTLDIPEICGLGLGFKFGGFRFVYVGVALIMWSMTALFSGEYFEHYRNRSRYYFFYLLTLGATVGVFLSKDLYTAFIFFEIMSLTSYTWVAHDEKPAALKAAGTYLAVAVIGGLVMLMGVIMCYHLFGTLEIDMLHDAAGFILAVGTDAEKAAVYTAGGLILFGYGAKAGMFPLHIWLPKAHPVAPAPASALLSGILTKSGIYGVLILCFEVFRGDVAWGTVILILGCITMFLGAVLAVFSIDLKRTLACSSMSQIGFILVGCAFSVFLNTENSLAAGGTVLYMVNHSLFKLVLFMCAGAVYMKLHRLNLNDIRGFGRNKPLLKIAFAVGALGIMGVPFFSGYISKTLIHEGIVEFCAEAGAYAGIIKAVEWIFLISGGMTIGYMTKLFVAVFVEKPSEYVLQKEKELNASSKGRFAYALETYIALFVPAAFIVACGVYPSFYIDKLSVMMSDFTHAEPIGDLAVFSLENLKGFLITLVIGALVFLFSRRCLMRGKKGERVYVNVWPDKLDLEELLYRPLLLKWLPVLFGTIFKTMISLAKLIWKGLLFAGMWTGIFLSSVFEWTLYGIRRLFFKELQENKPTPIKDRMFAAVVENDDTLRIVSGSISYGMICILVGLIITIFYLLAAQK